LGPFSRPIYSMLWLRVGIGHDKSETGHPLKGLSREETPHRGEEVRIISVRRSRKVIGVTH
jgi:hypothetical protein